MLQNGTSTFKDFNVVQLKIFLVFLPFFTLLAETAADFLLSGSCSNGFLRAS